MNFSPIQMARFSSTKENIVDPKLEQLDPTPNIFELFRQFNKRFFWSHLDMVEVSWSGRQMTSCAGLCSFSPRSGHCRIRLSAPLLSLRPRKDLVETLLHEMIHAYLFITKNYKDRNDHGPEFHKHMYRINGEAGTNITVYHTFNDEVRHFQTHVWRCTGPCQKMGPFFGLVRRATNRAPGPNDKWWDAHRLKCYGNFEKIEEPPGYKNKKKSDKDSGLKGKDGGDIRNFFTPSSTASNIRTFKDLSQRTAGSSGGTLKNSGSSTRILKGAITPTFPSPATKASSNPPLTDGSVNDKVRSVWANKYPTKHKISEKTPLKIKKVIAQCDSCDMLLDESELESHRINCSSQSRPCPVCNSPVPAGRLEEHLGLCLSDSITEDIFATEDVTENGDNVNCPICGDSVPETEVNTHIDECLNIQALANEFKDSAW